MRCPCRALAWVMAPVSWLLAGCAWMPHAATAGTGLAGLAATLPEPAVSNLGSDVSTLPTTHPAGSWLPIDAPLLSLELRTRVWVRGRELSAVLDTGAMSTAMSEPVARSLGILGAEGDERALETLQVLDAHGRRLRGFRAPLGELRLGRHTFRDVRVLVVGDQPDLLLIGADVLQHLDLYVAAEEGLVGLFDAGAAPTPPKARSVELQREARSLRVQGASPARTGSEVSFRLVIDTGASHTSVPAMVGINGGLPADLAYETTTRAVGGAQEDRGRFLLAPLQLGTSRTPVGRVWALPSTIERGEGEGLLGNDVFMRGHTVISFARGLLQVGQAPERPPHRSLGPGGVTCVDAAGVRTPCARVTLREIGPGAGRDGSLSGYCLEVAVADVYRGRTLELALTAENEPGVPIFSGGALRVYVTVGQTPKRECFRLWPQLERLGLSKASRLALRWMRAEGVRFPCDPAATECISFTGPLARLPPRSALPDGR